MGQTHKNSEFRHKFLWKHYIHHRAFTDFFISSHVCPLPDFSRLAAFVSLYTCSQFQHQSWEIYREIMTPAWASMENSSRKIECSLHTLDHGARSSSSNQRTVSRSRDLSWPIKVRGPRGQFSGCKLASRCIPQEKYFERKNKQAWSRDRAVFAIMSWIKVIISLRRNELLFAVYLQVINPSLIEISH